MPDVSWNTFRKWLFDAPDLGFRLDVSRMDLPDDLLERMEPALRAAVSAMERLESGAIANPDEERMVGHYWLRAPELAPDREITEAIERTRDDVIEFSGRVHSGDVRPERSSCFEHLLVVGIGGSALGPQLVADALGGADDRLSPHFLDNTDPDGIDRVLRALPPQSTLVVVVSKSGGTPETRNGMLEADAVWTAAGLDFGRHAVAVTQDGSKLDRFALDRGFLARFPMWDWVGGRTSATSAVGLLPAALQGIDVRRMLGGAAAMDRLTRRPVAAENPALQLAAAWHHAGNGRGDRAMVVLPYKDRLLLLSRYLQQLVMESLGKALDLEGRTVNQGISVYGNKGSTDQHAYVQQLRDGRSDFFATFIQVLRDGGRSELEVDDGVRPGDYLNGFLLGTRAALHDNGRPSMTISVRDVTPESLGMLVALFERAVGFYASLVGVNAYHQPGVEAGKRAAADVLDLQRRVVSGLTTEAMSCESVAATIGETDRVETVFWILERLAANPGRGVERLRDDSDLFESRYRRHE